MYGYGTPTDQRAGVRPISFLLDNGGSVGAPITLKIRPEELTRSEPSRITVHQTLGRETAGWVDNFGEGLPSVTLSGHTGWRPAGMTAEDGFNAFMALNKLVTQDYHAAKQAAIDRGSDPASVKLLFVDMLDDFAWNVAPTMFVLKRSKSRPLLLQYNISLQAVSTSIDNPLSMSPFFGNIGAGLESMTGVVGFLQGVSSSVSGWVSQAVGFVQQGLSSVAGVVQKFVTTSSQIFGAVTSTISAVKNGIGQTVNNLVGIAKGIAQTGINIFRTVAAIKSLPGYLKHSLAQVAAAYTEAFCILRNSLRPRNTYDDYTGLYGASNCSSTTGGRPASAYVSSNAFALMQPEAQPVDISPRAVSSMSSLNRYDPALAPVPIQTMGRYVTDINNGITINVLK